MTFETAFAKIKEKTKDAKTDKLVGEFAIQVNLTNKDCHGAFYVSYFNGKLSVEPFDYIDRWALLSISTVAFDKLITGELDVDAAIDEGKISVEGDVACVKQLTTLVRPVKKITSKKTTVKKQTAELVKKAAPAKKSVKKTADKAVKVAKEVTKKVSDKAKSVDAKGATKKATTTVKKTTEAVVKKASDVKKKVVKKTK